MQANSDALRIFNAAVHQVRPEVCLPPVFHCDGTMLVLGNKCFALDRFRNIYVIGAGKASAAMAQVAEQQLGQHIQDGFIVTKTGHGLPLRVMRQMEAGHPLPDANSIAATEEILELMQRLTNDDLLIVMLSGGASSLLADLPPGCTLEDLQQVYRLLLHCGATIHETNTVRKQLSMIKGGGMAAKTNGCTTVVFMISDVMGDNPGAIASGPFMPDTCNRQDALAVISKYGLWDKLPERIQHFFQQDSDVLQKPGPMDPCFKRIRQVLAATNTVALEAARAEAEKLGYATTIISKAVDGEAREAAKKWVGLARNMLGKCCLLGGGETTVTVLGEGKGGRNQEFALAALIELKEESGITILSGGTDGTDGITDAAGAMIAANVYASALARHIDPQDYLNRNDAWHFFRQTGGLVITGPTQTNVMDIVVVLTDRP